MGYDPMVPYDGSVASTIAIKQQELSFYLQAQQAFAAGAQSYKIGPRETQYIDPQKLQSIIDGLMRDIVLLQHGGQRQGFSVIPRDI